MYHHAQLYCYFLKNKCIIKLVILVSLPDKEIPSSSRHVHSRISMGGRNQRREALAIGCILEAREGHWT
jgi:hypothetical protein